ncbi:allantoinase PuuE [Xanthomonas campestris pv. campestris]|uniref:Polysaccharide deacetylase n=1 Tax=Xanthomonas campestris pv. campestris (strain B100) TaxID=509169 RepID=B0RM51_XANCB|nr:allantoinase PuuE [Xanthomonas campestris]MCF8798300.1 allantoinase PuuE [Xanthomonas campestris pv. campestris]MCF8812036.1 allantoinase PuuE [Xanthomonas campestris pv. campestris]MDO0844259.1 allantoinase PuuE [Xanthomonas campestris pv. campestris]MDO0845639.1 allantoinase PuuE [Xanthomonas campestris pv. campestris]MEA0622677.1 allantoinase PuuE [Xanthomonas campestris pv. campestris]
MSTARDLVGYGATPPPAQWPGGARIAVQFVINYEEGAENCVLNGDAGSEAFLSEMVGAPSHPGARAMAMESLYEYGSRAGFWRLHRLFSARGVPVTVFGVATALAANPEAVAAMQSADWEIASHGLRWIDYQHVDAATERAHLAEAIALHTQVTGSRPLGWYQGRTSPSTARLVAEEGGFVYDADSYADDVPYYDRRHGRAQLIVPYTLDVNDMKFVAYNGFADGEPFFRYLHDSFEQLRSEGGRMLSIGLHGRIVGKPARAAALARFVDHVLASGDAWVARRIDIARHWLQVHPA